MRLFSLTKEIAIDLGTANTIIIHNDKIVIDEPSIVALDKHTDKLIAVGKEAQQMQGKEHEGIRTVRPLRKGVIADFNAAELMIRGLVKKASSKSNWFQPSLRMVVGIPSGSTEVEIRAVRDSSEHAGGRDVYMIYEPMAAALGIGLDVEAPEGNMIVDIGGGTTEIAVISLGGIVSNMSIQIAGDDLTDDIMNHMKRAHNVRVGERTAELIKMNVGSALTELDNPPADYIVHGPNQMTALPMEVPVSYQEICHCIEKSILKIEAAVLGALEQTPPELYADIVRNGIYLAGGGALLRGLDKRLTNKIGIQFHIAEDPLLSVAKGTGVALKNIDRFLFALAPYLVIIASMLAFAVLPWANGLQVIDFNIGIFFLLAVSSIGVLGILLAGWSSNNKFTLIGALRSGSQMVSYELSTGLSVLTMVCLAGSMSVGDIVASQERLWFLFSGHLPAIIAFIIFLIAGTAETNRGPFDLPEAESELTAGYHTEYSGIHFGFFYLAEYLNLFIVSGVASLMFLGGWMPFHIPGWEGFNHVMDYIPGLVWFLLKCFTLSFVIIWFKWTFPRIRIDQMLKLEWKYLLPINLFNLVLMAIIIVNGWVI